jgi:hypothetical protein
VAPLRPTPPALAALAPPSLQAPGCGGDKSGQGYGPGPCSGNAESGSSVLREGVYELAYPAQGPTVVFIASEPITGAARRRRDAQRAGRPYVRPSGRVWACWGDAGPGLCAALGQPTSPCRHVRLAGPVERELAVWAAVLACGHTA